MKIDEYDEIEKKIYNLHNIVSIHFEDLETLVDGEHSIIPGFIVFYNGLDNLFLTVFDKHFSIFVRRLREVYQKEKDNIVDVSFGVKKQIEIDETTERILLDGSLEEIDEMCRFYDKKRGFNESLFIINNEIKGILPIVKYHLEEVLKLFNYVIKFGDKLRGYNNTFNIDGVFNGVERLIPFTFKKKSFNSYSFVVGGLLNKGTSIVINIFFLEKKIAVETIIEEYNFVDYRTYELTNKGLDEEVYTYLDDKLKRINKRSLNEAHCPYPNLVFMERQDDINWYLLPWNGIFGYAEKDEDITDEESFISSRSIYLNVNKDNYLIKDNFSKVYKRDSSVLVATKSVRLDESSKSVIGVLYDGLVIIETSFDNNGVTGYYKDALGGKYFYHGSTVTDLKEITASDFISLGESINEKADLLRRESIKRLVRGNK